MAVTVDPEAVESAALKLEAAPDYIDQLINRAGLSTAGEISAEIAAIESDWRGAATTAKECGTEIIEQLNACASDYRATGQPVTMPPLSSKRCCHEYR